MPNQSDDNVVVSDEAKEEIDDEIDELITRRVERLQDLDKKRESYLENYLKERAALEAKFSSIYSKLYEERARIVKGKDATSGDNEASINGIPHFWVSTLSNMETVGQTITEEDVDCLDGLQDITCQDDPDGKGFTLQFFFAANNPYFENRVLTKRYQVPNLLLGDEPLLKKVEGCEINWKAGKDLTQQVVTKKQRGKGKQSGQLRTVSRTEKKDSFFSWFNPLTMPPLEEMNEEVAAQLEASFELDYEVAQALRTQIIPKAVQWFTGDTEQAELDEAVDDLVEAEPE
jgi:nucleosome assembly protein 1-like 1